MSTNILDNPCRNWFLSFCTLFICSADKYKEVETLQFLSVIFILSINSSDSVDRASVLYRLLISPIQKSFKLDVTELRQFSFFISMPVNGKP